MHKGSKEVQTCPAMQNREERQQSRGNHMLCYGSRTGFQRAKRAGEKVLHVDMGRIKQTQEGTEGRSALPVLLLKETSHKAQQRTSERREREEKGSAWPACSMPAGHARAQHNACLHAKMPKPHGKAGRQAECLRQPSMFCARSYVTACHAAVRHAFLLPSADGTSHVIHETEPSTDKIVVCLMSHYRY